MGKLMVRGVVRQAQTLVKLVSSMQCQDYHIVPHNFPLKILKLCRVKRCTIF